VTPDERSKLVTEIRALQRAFGRDWPDDHAVQFVAAAIPTLIDDIRRSNACVPRNAAGTPLVTLGTPFGDPVPQDYDPSDYKDWTGMGKAPVVRGHMRGCQAGNDYPCDC
jgi:hypothetical protein